MFTDELDREMMERSTLESGLRQALSRDELFLEYQPQVDLRTGTITGLEALLRWNHSTLGLISPNEFIGIAENSGLIVPIGEWVMRNACNQARAWQAKGLPAVPVAVNVSAVQFRQRGFCDVVKNILQETGLPPELLELELTESLLLNNPEVMTSITAALRDMGVTLAIDDFGTGYSSLGYLKSFKVNRLKIARSFVKDVSVDADDAAITIAIIEMARALNLAVLAEGVELESQLSFLRKQECYTIQGFYFSKPASAEKIGSMLKTGFRHMI
jgi:EAL domain-containing protein (putative c-di-GMP-specific phosphodiesterase class I)